MEQLTRHETDVPEIIGVSQAILAVIDLADSVAPSDCSVLIEGESGTGKELIARRLWVRSRRSTKPFIAVNCAGISETLFESQFFGHVRGAFTGAEQEMLGLIRTADSGTLFLDEVGEIPLKMQPKLLRSLQEQEVMPVGRAVPVRVNTRFIAGTNRNLSEMVRSGGFRRDLYYRLNIVRIVVPPLRERPDDVPVLFDHFNRHFAARYERPPVRLRQKVRTLLASYLWPGNVRELAALVERIHATGLEPELLAEMMVAEGGPHLAEFDPNSPDTMALEQVERRAIQRAMDHCDLNQRKAARLLKVHRATLARKLRKHGLS